LAYRVNPILDVSLGSEDLRLQEIVDRYGWEEAKKDTEVRRFLQELGTQARHVLGPDVWVDAVMKRAWQDVEYGHPVVFSDVRFPNEADAVREMGGIVVRVVRPGFENGVDPSHPSESQVDDLGHEFTVLNDGTLAQLENRLQLGLMNYMVGRGVRG